MRAARFFLCAAMLAVLAGCTTTITPTNFRPTSSARSSGTVKLDSVRYLPGGGLAQNQVEFHKMGKLMVHGSIADLVRAAILKELENSGFRIGDGGAVLWVDVKRCALFDKFTSLEFLIEATYRLQVGQKTVSRDLRAARRHMVYTNPQKAVDLNAMISETYEVFFTDPEVKTMLAAP